MLEAIVAVLLGSLAVLGFYLGAMTTIWILVVVFIVWIVVLEYLINVNEFLGIAIIVIFAPMFIGALAENVWFGFTGDTPEATIQTVKETPEQKVFEKAKEETTFGIIEWLKSKPLAEQAKDEK